MFDPHTTFLNIKEKERFDQAMNNEFVGIGARLQDEDGYCTIKNYYRVDRPKHQEI